MATGSGIRKKLETEYLAQSLQGHIQYYATSYSRSPDHEGRAAIRYDGNEIIKGCYWNNWMKADLFPGDEKYKKRMEVENAHMDDTALRLSVFGQRCFYNAFAEFDDAGRMKLSSYYDRVVDVMEELVKFTLLTRDCSDYLVSRYSERRESAEELSKRVNQRSI